MAHAQAISTTPDLRPTKINPVCLHRRMIDDVLTAGGEKTGMVRCLECLKIIPDPYLSLSKALG